MMYFCLNKHHALKKYGRVELHEFLNSSYKVVVRGQIHMSVALPSGKETAVPNI